MLHGRPLACFRPEQNSKNHSRSYSLIAELAAWPRVKYMVTMWPDHVPFWRPIVPCRKLYCLDAPPIDERRFCAEGEEHNVGPAHRGDFNILIADSWREDIDVYEIAHAPLFAASKIRNMRVHFYAVETPLGPWEHIFTAYRKAGILGEVCARMPDMEKVYRSMDCLLTPHRIATRVMAEALSCGLPVVGGLGCKWTSYTGSPESPQSVAEALVRCYQDWKLSPAEVNKMALQTASSFRLQRYIDAMNPIYKSIIHATELLPWAHSM